MACKALFLLWWFRAEASLIDRQVVGVAGKMTRTAERDEALRQDLSQAETELWGTNTTLTQLHMRLRQLSTESAGNYSHLYCTECTGKSSHTYLLCTECTGKSSLTPLLCTECTGIPLRELFPCAPLTVL